MFLPELFDLFLTTMKPAYALPLVFQLGNFIIARVSGVDEPPNDMACRAPSVVTVGIVGGVAAAALASPDIVAVATTSTPSRQSRQTET